nr:MAG TPA: hypothetical protein [Caudoviricetes sp.]
MYTNSLIKTTGDIPTKVYPQFFAFIRLFL